MKRVTKHCGDCNGEKSLSDFHRRGKGWQSVCKSCRKLRDAGRKYDLAKKKIIQRKFIEWREDLKRNKPCSDCGNIFHTAAMHWDHLPGAEKFREVSSLWSRKLVLEEIKKCELVCANCHSIRTWNRNRLGVGKLG